MGVRFTKASLSMVFLDAGEMGRDGKSDDRLDQKYPIIFGRLMSLHEGRAILGWACRQWHFGLGARHLGQRDAA